MVSRIAAPGDLAGAVLLSLAFGTIHAFAALMAPLELALHATRSQTSLIYSLAIVSLTAGVFAAPRLMAIRASLLTSVIGCTAALGLITAAASEALLGYLAGYGVVFGFSNGVAYVVFLTLAAAAMPQARGWSASVVTAAYGLGAALAAPVFALALVHVTVVTVMAGMAGTILITGLAAALLFGNSTPAAPATRLAIAPSWPFTGWLWAVYLLGASGGLMIIAHSAALAGKGAPSQLAPTLVALGNIVGSLIGGPFAEWRGPSTALAAPLALSALAMFMLLLAPEAGLAAITLCGVTYGWLIAAIPAVIRSTQGNERVNVTFGYVFTAWGLAGLVAPVAAGAAFDAWNDYRPAIAIAASASLAGLLIAMRPPSAAKPSIPAGRPHQP